jgi:enoyl-[acyl-carrier protein] reductase/trans-2-enoyl-CoA reductase (NAD+)
MRPDVQEKVAKLWIEAVTENLSEMRFRRIQKGFL